MDQKLDNGTACSLASPKLRYAERPGKGRAVLAAEPIAAGEFVAMIGGQAITLTEALQMPQDEQSQCLQVGEDHVLWISGFKETLADWINHSCNPNVGLEGQITLVAMRDIAAGEDICFDYAMSDGSPIDEFPCACGAVDCRGRVTGNDWARADLQERYRGFFSPYLARRIAGTIERVA